MVRIDIRGRTQKKCEPIQPVPDSLLNHNSLQGQRKFTIFLDFSPHLSANG